MVIARYESFGGIIHLKEPPAQLYVDQNMMKQLGYPGSPLWSQQMSHLSAPCEVHFSITNKCSLTCPDCYANGGPALPNELTTDEILRAIDIFAEIGVFQLAFGGGEPFCHPDIFELAEHAASKGIVPNITTNGSLITGDVARKCRVFGQINVSMDEPPGAKLGLRGADGLACADRAIRLLVKGRIPVGINMVVSAANFCFIEAMAKYARSIGVSDILLLRFKPIGRGQTRYNQMALRADHLRRLIPLAERLMRKYKVKFRADCSLFPALAYAGASIELLDYWGVAGCDAGNNLVSVDPQGGFKACSFCSDIGGSIFSLPSAWGANQHLSRFRNWVDRAPQPCDRCRYLHLCRGGCHPIADVETGSFWNPDPACPIFYNYRQKEQHPALMGKLRENV